MLIKGGVTLAKKTVNQKVDELGDHTKEQIRDKIGRGESIRSICEDLHQEYAVVARFCWREGILPWRGAKRYITLRLNRLKQLRRQTDREQLAEEIREQVDYIYYAARQLTLQKEKAKRSLELSD